LLKAGDPPGRPYERGPRCACERDRDERGGGVAMQKKTIMTELARTE